MSASRSRGAGLVVHGIGLLLVTVVLVVSTWTAAALSSPTPSDVRVSGTNYVRQDGGTDAAIATCGSSDPAKGSSARQQDEPTAAINPMHPSVIAAGANDYCGVPVFGDAWMGFYASVDGGATWKQSLNPGYPADTSAAGMTSPIFGIDTNSGDPGMAWDAANHLFYGGLAFNRVATNPGGQALTFSNVIVSTWHDAGGVSASAPLGIAYDRTVIVGPGTPAPHFVGLGNDKPAIGVDTWATSPFENNVYVSWTLFPGLAGSDQIMFVRSTDHGQTFSGPIKISMGVANAQDSAISVAPGGTVYVTWHQFGFRAVVPEAVVFVKSTDGGMTFTAPSVVQTIVPYDRSDVSVSGGGARDCGSLAAACVSGFTFPRTDDTPTVVADDQGAVYVAWEQVLPATPSGGTYRPAGQSQVQTTKSTDGGSSWSAPKAVDPQAVGHQQWPNLAFDKSTDKLYLIYYDSREDPSYSPFRPPGDTAAGKSACLASAATVASASCDVLNTVVATSTDHGATWTATKVSSMGHQPDYEMFGGRTVPFQGDYLTISAAGGHAFGVWTDNRNVVPGEDLRETQPGGPGTTKAPSDGFDVMQCRAWSASTMTWGPDNCPNAGGLDQNIYGAGIS